MTAAGIDAMTACTTSWAPWVIDWITSWQSRNSYGKVKLHCCSAKSFCEVLRNFQLTWTHHSVTKVSQHQLSVQLIISSLQSHVICTTSATVEFPQKHSKFFFFFFFTRLVNCIFSLFIFSHPGTNCSCLDNQLLDVDHPSARGVTEDVARVWIRWVSSVDQPWAKSIMCHNKVIGHDAWVWLVLMLPLTSLSSSCGTKPTSENEGSAAASLASADKCSPQHWKMGLCEANLLTQRCNLKHSLVLWAQRVWAGNSPQTL